MFQWLGKHRPTINNQFYDDLGDQWYQDDRHPVALLRIESRTKLDYVKGVLWEHFNNDAKIIDIACGAGFLSVPLAKEGHQVLGIDISESSLEQARQQGSGCDRVNFTLASAYQLPADDHSFDVALMMDCLEHFEEPERALKEASRVIKPGGFLIYHTFNRTFLSYLMAVKAIEWFAVGAPKHIHVYHMFIKPEELREMLDDTGFEFIRETGLGPKFNLPLVKSVLARSLQTGVAFEQKDSMAIGYMGLAQKRSKIDS